jgi:6-phosphofructokinase
LASTDRDIVIDLIDKLASSSSQHGRYHVVEH